MSLRPRHGDRSTVRNTLSGSVAWSSRLASYVGLRQRSEERTPIAIENPPDGLRPDRPLGVIMAATPAGLSYELRSYEG